MTETVEDRPLEQLSTAPIPVEAPAPSRGFGRRALRLWRQLTSMRTALVLLAMLALAAIPGTVIPQRGLDPVKVDNYVKAHPHLGPLLDHLSLFDVFASPWFAAIYLLLFLSLVGCLVPRIRMHVATLRRRPPHAPRNLDRLPVSTSWRSGATPEQVAQRARSMLRSSRWRADVHEEPGGTVTVAAEKGYSRETGNLVFHVALLLLLIGIAQAGLFGYKGTVLVKQNGSFTNTRFEYDVFSPSRLFKESELKPFSFTLNKFTAAYQPNGEPTAFNAAVDYRSSPSAAAKPYDIRVNHPLQLGGTKVFLTGHGYAPHITVTDPHGTKVFDEDVAFLPDNGEFFSHGVVKVTSLAPKQLGLLGFFYPTYGIDSSGSAVSTYPGLSDPVLSLTALTGKLSVNAGAVESDYDLPITKALTDIGSKQLAPGQSWKLPNGDVVRFGDVTQWATFQIADEPGKRIVLLAAVLVIAGLILSLTVRRRRFWIRAIPAPDGDTDRRTVVAAAGLSRTDSDGFAAELDDLTARIQEG